MNTVIQDPIFFRKGEFFRLCDSHSEYWGVGTPDPKETSYSEVQMHYIGQNVRMVHLQLNKYFAGYWPKHFEMGCALTF